jgi:pyrroline-5-carboxylate reductase
MKIGFIGSGKMAEAIIAGLLRAKITRPAEIFASDVSDERRSALKKEYGVNTYGNNALIAAKSNVLFLCIKPQQLDGVLQEIASSVSREHLVISIAAGKKLATIEAALPQARVIRIMPNVGCLVSEAMSAMTLGARTTAADSQLAGKLLSNVGRVVQLPEDQFDAVTALSGSGPAFFAFLLDKLSDAAVAEGLDRQSALLLAKQTMLGTAKLLLDKAMDPKALIEMVASAKGTTAEGLKVLEGSSIAEIMRETVSAAARRSRELSSVHSP